MGCAEFLENVERSPRDASRLAQDQRPEEGRSTAAPRNRARRRRRVGRGGTCPRRGARGAPEDTRTRSVYGSERAMNLGHREGGHGNNRRVTSIGGRGRGRRPGAVSGFGVADLRETQELRREMREFSCRWSGCSLNPF